MSLPDEELSLQHLTYAAALEYQNKILIDVSRTFALTIPELPHGLRDVVANAYLLCRIADTIEDEPTLSAANKTHSQQFFVATLANKACPDKFATQLSPLLSDSTSPAEHDLIAKTSSVLRVTHHFSQAQQNALFRCVYVMGRGMSRYQNNIDHTGLATQRDLDDYCYFVAGVVGDMLTELFCLHDKKIDQHRTRLMHLSASFGQALQMTNILKDVWDDQKRGVCWWPRSIFEAHGITLAKIKEQHLQPGFTTALNELIGTAHGHILNALEYTLLMPRNQTGIRQFCLWALGLAMLTLRNIHAKPDYQHGNDVKVTRKNVKQVIIVSRLCIRSNSTIKLIFRQLGKHLPLQAIDDIYVPIDSFSNCGPMSDFNLESNVEDIPQQQFG